MNIDESLKNIEDKVVEMGEKVIEQHQVCITILNSKNKEDALKVIKNDEYINKVEEEINKLAIAEFALLNPVASDLRKVLAAVKIASELERIGDYAKSLASFIIKRDEDYHELMEYAVVCEKEVIAMLTKAMDAYKRQDVDLAFEIPQHRESIEVLTKEFRNKLQNYTSVDLKYIFYLSTLIRSINRGADHTTNICEHIIYLIKGIHYDFD